MKNLSDLPVVIIPAYNESAVILKLLRSIKDGFDSGKYLVVVACNGCRDDTVALVQQGFPEYVCLDITKASKVNAINEAESLGLGYPRLYVDADVDISTTSVLHLIEAASSEKTPVLVAPRANIHSSESSSLVRLFYSAWEKTTFFIDQGFGSGVYVLNQGARNLFDCFPDIVSDDGFVRRLSPDLNIIVSEVASSTVEAPRALADLVKIKIRAKVGNSQLAAYSQNQTSSLSGRRFVIRPGIREFFVYMLINLYVRFKVKRELLDGAVPVWHRDESSRV